MSSNIYFKPNIDNDNNGNNNEPIYDFGKTKTELLGLCNNIHSTSYNNIDLYNEQTERYSGLVGGNNIHLGTATFYKKGNAAWSKEITIYDNNNNIIAVGKLNNDDRTFTYSGFWNKYSVEDTADLVRCSVTANQFNNI